jgi:hypothetical protein
VKEGTPRGRRARQGRGAHLKDMSTVSKAAPTVNDGRIH